MKVYNSPETIYRELAPASQNNSREIFRSLCARFLKYPSEWLGNKITEMFGLEADWSDKDYGEPPNKFNN